MQCSITSIECKRKLVKFNQSQTQVNSDSFPFFFCPAALVFSSLCFDLRLFLVSSNYVIEDAHRVVIFLQITFNAGNETS